MFIATLEFQTLTGSHYVMETFIEIQKRFKDIYRKPGDNYRNTEEAYRNIEDIYRIIDKQKTSIEIQEMGRNR